MGEKIGKGNWVRQRKRPPEEINENETS